MTRHAVDEAFAALKRHRARLARLSMRGLFAEDARRFERFSIALGPILYDYSKHKVTARTMALLVDLAEAAGVAACRDAMFSGAAINATEGRAVLHVALRHPDPHGYATGGRAVMPDILAERARMFAFAEDVRSGALRAAGGAPFRTIVNIGIGGSDLGPAMAAEALSPYRAAGLEGRFVSNVDGAHMADTLQGIDIARTLFIVASKTFTTVETMTNAATARRAVAERLGEAAVGAHFAAVSTNTAAVKAFGIDESRMFRFWDWVGGRYSLWSVIGLPLAILIGRENFTAFLDGAHAVDRHFRTAPAEANVPVVMALLGVLRRNVFEDTAHAVLPYDQRLARFPAYLQQLDMESNGKRVRLDGRALARASGPVIFGEPGTNGQHAFFQLLHQGTDVVPADFLVAAEGHEAGRTHHDLLFANALAQTEALMNGRTAAEAEALMRARGMPAEEARRLAPHRAFPGERPTATLLYPKLTPEVLGMLIALYEHKVFVQAAIWGVNAFDQWGVELGKELATRLAPVVAGTTAVPADLDGSTRGLLARAAAMRGH